MTIWQANADLSAHRSETYTDQTRHAATREAVALLVSGSPFLAAYQMARAIERQARVLGIAGVVVAPTSLPGGPSDAQEVAA